MGLGFFGSILIGGIAGWIASRIMNASTGIIANIALGIVGAMVANWLLGLVGISAEPRWISQLVVGGAGACLLIFAARKLRS